jgi:SAM-dependent methyltransferase
VPDQDPQRLFDAFYFAHGCGEPYQRTDVWLALFNAFADRICQDINPQSVLDAGCAMGFLVEALRMRGVEAWGVDISQYAIERVAQECRQFCWQASITEPFHRNYDLIICIEVLEHLPRAEAEKAVRNLCNHSDDILFSSTPLDYKEVTHFNVQPPEYWGEAFARQSFFRDIDFDASFITPWAVRFRRSKEPVHRIVRDYERRFWTLWKENLDLRELSQEMRDRLAQDDAVQVQITENESTRTSDEGIIEKGIKSRLGGLRRWATKK